MKNIFFKIIPLLLLKTSLYGQIEVTHSTVGNINCAQNLGFIKLHEVGGGKPPYSFTWSNGATSQNISNLLAGIYSVTILDSNTPSLVGHETYNVKTDTIRPIANAGQDKQLTCSMPQVVLNATGSSSISIAQSSWSTTNGHFSNTFPYPNAIAKAPGLYILKTDRSNTGCVDFDTVVVTQTIDMPLADAGEPQTLYCINPEIQLDGTGSSTGAPGYTYLWEKFLGTGIVFGENTLVPSIDQPGKYLLKVTNQSTGCFSISSVDVQEDTTKPKAYFYQQPVHINCKFDTLPLHLTVEPFGATFTYQWGTWGTPVGHIVSGLGTPDILVDSAGTYTVTVTNTQNGCKDFESFGVDYYFSTPIVNAGNDVFLGCNGGLTILNATNLPGGTPDIETGYFGMMKQVVG